MSVTDPIADLLTRIRNANQMRYNEVVVPKSNVKLEIVKILKDEGYIADYKVIKEEVQDNIVITLKYGKNKSSPPCVREKSPTALTSPTHPVRSQISRHKSSPCIPKGFFG